MGDNFLIFCNEHYPLYIHMDKHMLRAVNALTGDLSLASKSILWAYT